jgi:hypothetical protein
MKKQERLVKERPTCQTSVATANREKRFARFCEKHKKDLMFLSFELNVLNVSNNAGGIFLSPFLFI